MNEAKQETKHHRPHHTQHIPLDHLLVTDLHSFPLDVDRLTQMAAAYAAGASYAIHPLAVCRTPIGFTILDGRLRALVRQAAGEKIVPCRIFDLVESEWAAFRYSSGKNRTSRPVTMETAR
jgi:hypothetical protein